MAEQRATPGRVRSARRQFAAATLTFEAFVVLFATVAAYGLRVGPPGAIWGAGLTLMVVCLLLAGLLRFPGGYVAGSIVQLVVIAGGFVVTALFFVGGVFAVLWVVALRLGGRIDRERAERADPGPAPDAGPPVGDG